MKKILLIACAIVLVVVIVGWSILNPGPEHIEDTNGAENYSLQQITPKDVAEHKMGARGGPGTSETHWEFGKLEVSSGMKYSSRKFTGVYLLYSATIFKGSDIYLYLPNFSVKSGNFAFYVLLDGEIIGEAKPDEYGCAELLIENIDKTGKVEYVIAGESANFEFVAPDEWE